MCWLWAPSTPLPSCVTHVIFKVSTSPALLPPGDAELKPPTHGSTTRQRQRCMCALRPDGAGALPESTWVKSSFRCDGVNTSLPRASPADPLPPSRAPAAQVDLAAGCHHFPVSWAPESWFHLLSLPRAPWKLPNIPREDCPTQGLPFILGTSVLSGLWDSF